MPPPVICVEHLSKRYLVGHRAERSRERGQTHLREVIGRGLRNSARKAADIARGRQIVQGDAVEEFWALRDVSFAVAEGEVLGIIGRNGAGKSTLLKILSRITDPTAGRVTLRGRVASLLEVGTGFHPELSGRENTYLNGAILGMSRAEIRRKFDEIVAFAEVEKFIDTPVKRYSSGMYVRLAFAVAAHLEPEILIVDEVLSVGDAEFQKKCLGKMDDISRRQGRTVLVVSHNMSSVATLADRALFLDCGSVKVNSSVSEAISAYNSNGPRGSTYERPVGDQSAAPHIDRVEVWTSERNGVHHFGEPLEIKFWIRHPQPMVQACLSFQIINQLQQPTLHAVASYPGFKFGRTPGRSLLVCKFPTLHLNVGRFYLRVFLSEPPGAEVYEVLDDIAHFEILRTDHAASSWGWQADACVYHEDCIWNAFEAITEAARKSDAATERI